MTSSFWLHQVSLHDWCIIVLAPVGWSFLYLRKIV